MFSSFVCVVRPFFRLLASHMADFVIWSVYHFLVTSSSGHRSQSHKLMSPGNQKHPSHGVLSNRHLDGLIAESYSSLFSSRLSVFLFFFFVSFFYSVVLSLFFILEYFLQNFFCTSFVSPVFSFFFFSFVSYVGCPYFQTYFIFRSFMSSSLVVFLRTVFSFLIIYSHLSSFIRSYVCYPNRPRHKNTCPPFLQMLWRNFTYLMLVLATKPLYTLSSSIVDAGIRIMSGSGREVL